jgi:hypothetical protein
MADLVLRALREIWTALEELGIAAALMGGLAVSAWKHVRATRDVDLLVSIEDSQLDALLQALAQREIQARRSPPVLSLGPFRLLQLVWEPPGAYLGVQVDLLLASSTYQQRALQRRVPTTVDGFRLAVLACEDLILHKLLAARMIDRADVVALVVENDAVLDWAYLEAQAAALGVKAELDTVVTEARRSGGRPG